MIVQVHRSITVLRQDGPDEEPRQYDLPESKTAFRFPAGDVVRLFTGGVCHRANDGNHLMDPTEVVTVIRFKDGSDVVVAEPLPWVAAALTYALERDRTEFSDTIQQADPAYPVGIQRCPGTWAEPLYVKWFEPAVMALALERDRKSTQ